MLTSIRSIIAAPLLAGTAFTAAPAMAQDSGVTLSGNVAIVSDYRFRGVSLSDGDPAIQGGIEAAHDSGSYVGTWASSISGNPAYGDLELEIFGGWSRAVSGAVVNVGMVYYIYPTGDVPGADTDYFEPYATVSTTLGPVSATLGATYAWKQDSLGKRDNLYLYTELGAGIPGTPVSLSARLGYTDGALATQADGTSFDWGIGASYAVTKSLSLGVNYVDTQGPSFENSTDPGLFLTLSYSI